MTTLADLARNMTPAQRDANPHLIADLSADERKLAIPHVLGEPTKADIKAEADLQTHCQNLANNRGYWKLTKENITRSISEDVQLKGWWGHINNARKNIIMPDFFCFDIKHTRPAFLAEFKFGSNPTWQPGQRELVEMGFWRLYDDYDDFEIAFSAWERGA